MLSCFSCVQFFATLWTVAHQAPLRGILQAKILEWVDTPSSRGSSRPRDWICVSFLFCIGRQILYRCSTCEALSQTYPSIKGTFLPPFPELLPQPLNSAGLVCSSHSVSPFRLPSPLTSLRFRRSHPSLATALQVSKGDLLSAAVTTSTRWR